MKRAWPCLCALIGLLFCFSEAAGADEVSDLKAQIQAMEERHMKEQQLHQKEMANLLARLDLLETKAAAGGEQVGDLESQQDQLAKELREKIDFDMYVTFEAESFNETRSSFDAKNAEFLARAQLHDRLTGFVELEFERTAQTSAGNRQGEVEVEQGWLEYYVHDLFKPRFGVILVPFGRYNLEHFDTMQDLTDRPIAMRRVIPTTWGEAGAGFTGQASLGKPLAWAGLNTLDLNYQAYLMNGLTAVITDSGLRDARGAFGSDNNNNKAFVGRVGVSPWMRQEIGLSGYVGAYDTDGHDIYGFDVDWHFERGPFELVGEWAFWDLQDGFQTTSASALTTTPVPPQMNGGYVEGRYHFWLEVLDQTFLGRGFKHPTLALIGRYGHVDITDDGDERSGDNVEERWTIGISYRPVETWAFKFEYQNNRTKTEALERGNSDGFIGSVTAAF